MGPEDLDLATGDGGPADPANKLLALAAEHDAADDLDPPRMCPVVHWRPGRCSGDCSEEGQNAGSRVKGLEPRFATPDSRLRTLHFRPSTMLSVALTGNIGAGKSTVAELFRRWGATIIDADQLVREAHTPGHPALQQVAGRFGRQMIRPDGTLDRAKLRAVVLADPEALEALNSIMHPEVHRRRRELLAEARARGDRIVVSDIPLLFEAADPSEFDAVVLVDAAES